MIISCREDEFMKKLSLKCKILFILFATFLIISAILFNFEQITLAVISFIVAIIFAVLLVINQKKSLNKTTKKPKSNLIVK